ncbi:Hypothetical predicted protein, partial [Podarcis lilfordi]
MLYVWCVCVARGNQISKSFSTVAVGVQGKLHCHQQYKLLNYSVPFKKRKEIQRCFHTKE